MAPDISLPATNLAIQKLSALCDLLRSTPLQHTARELQTGEQLVKLRQYSHSLLAKVRLPPKYEAECEDVEMIQPSTTSGLPEDSAQASKPATASHSPVKLAPTISETLTSPLKLATSIQKTAPISSAHPLFKAKPQTAPASPQEILVSKQVVSVPWSDRSMSKSFSAGIDSDMQASDRMKIQLVKEKLEHARQASGWHSSIASAKHSLFHPEQTPEAHDRIPASDEMAGADRLYEWMLDEDEQPLMLTRWISAGMQAQSPIKMRAPSGALAKRRFASGVHRELEKLGIPTSLGSG